MEISLEPPKFDAYRATVLCPPGRLLGKLKTALETDHELTEKPHNGYAHAVRLTPSSGSLLFQWGGVHEYPNVFAQGDASVPVSGVLRGLDHTPSRIDVAVDTDTPGAYEYLMGALMTLAAEKKIRSRHLTDVNFPDEGSTFYMGTRQSEAYGRLYEKGKQLPEQERPDWVRWEVEYKPQKPVRKRWAAEAGEWEILGASLWSRTFMSEHLGTEATAPPKLPRPVSDLDRALGWLCKQYGSHLEDFAALCNGDMALFGQELMLRVAERDTPRVWGAA